MKTLILLATLSIFCGQALSKSVWNNSTVSVKDVNVADKEVCEFCEGAFNHVQQILKAYEPQLKIALKNFCKHTGSYSTECESIVDNYVDKVLDFLIKDFNSKEFCTLITLCPGVSKTDVNVANKEVCEFCEGAFNHVQQILKAYEPQLKVALKNFCKHTGSYSTECEFIVDNYVDKTLDFFIKDFINSKEFCTLINLCPGVSKTKIILEDEFCKVYTQVETLLINELKKNTTKEMVEREVTSLCKKSGQFTLICQSMVNSKFSELYEMLINTVDKTNFCQDSSNQTAVITQDQSSGKYCSECLQIFGTIKMLLNNPAIKNSVKTELETLCTALFSECKLVLDMVFDKLFNYVTRLLDPYEICDDLKFCNLSSVVKPKTDDEIERSNICLFCVEAVDTTKELLNNTNIREIVKQEITGACSSLPVAKTVCKSFVESYFDTVYDKLIKTLDDDKLCTKLGVCETNAKDANGLSMDFCPICETAFQALENEVSDAEFQKEFKSTLLQLCTELGKYSSECTLFIDAFGDEIIKSLVSAVNPKKICTDFDFCSKNSSALISQVYSPETCSICKVSLEYIKDTLSSNSTTAEIKSTVLGICDSLGGYSSSCKGLVNTYFDAGYQLILGYLDPVMICSDIDLCPGAKHSLSKKVQEMVNSLSSESCRICQDVVQTARHDLSDKTMQGILKKGILRVCPDLGALSNLCQKLVNNYYSLAIELLIDELNPKTICADIDLCSADNSDLTQLNLKSNGEECLICKGAIGILKEEVQKPAVKTAIQNELLNICPYLGSYSKECVSYINAYYPLAYSTAVSYLDANEVCTAIDLCSEPPKNSSSMVGIEEIQLGSVKCDMCQTITTLYAKEIQDAEEKAKTFAYAEIQKLCTKLPGDIKDQCKDFISVYGPPILQMVIEEYGNPKLICSELKVC